MSFHLDFTCKYMRRDTSFVPSVYPWRCLKRESAFTNIDKHCFDCPQYQKFLDEIKRFLEE